MNKAQNKKTPFKDEIP
uniref:Uncharacterized protein n=1 Tax=Anguilla anguilla TaxID=7936 RepID=A0A0E9QL48_ANGAN